MDKYENLGLVGEGSYGMVMKCRNKENGRIVAIKKFLESDDDKTVKKIAMREIKLLKQLRHENLVNLLEVCKKKRRWYLVFEFVDRTLLDDLEQFPNGLDYNKVKKYLFQILRAITFCHHHSIIHRDIKPENILVSQYGVVKLCDFGFARTMAAPGEVYTDYVATRWYRAPELLVGDTKYGKAVDVWAVGCLIVEMLTGEPLFPGDSDIDQVYHVMRCFGNLTQRHQELFYKNPTFAGVRLPEIKEIEPLERRFSKLSSVVLDLVKKCLQIDPDNRLSCSELLQHEYFNKDGFAERFTQELNTKFQKGLKENTPVPKKSKMTKRDKDDSLVEDKKLRSQDSNADIKNKDNKPNVKIRSKELRAEVEKLDRSATTNGNEILEKTTESRASLSKAVPPSLKDVNGNHDRPKSPAGTLIPPISQYPLAITTSCMNLNAGSGTVPGPHSFRANEKMKKHMPLFKKQSQQQPMSSHYNVSLAARFPNERSGIQERSIHTDRMGNAIKKKWEFCKSDVHLPELNSNHLPELKGVEGKNSKILKKENRKVPESRIPSLAAMDLHSSVPSQQISGSSFHEPTEANFPRVEY